MNGNRIYFGRYTGNTPEPGHEKKETGNPDRRRIERLAQKLTDLQRGAKAARKYAREKESKAETDEEREAAREIAYFFPCLDGAEMRSRWDMQESPPDILITNYSMLSIMLMREVDSPIFKRTREWLEQPGNVFHLIIDELHVYRGTSGTEVAFLLRLLLNRLGLSPSDPRLRILASSASLDPNSADSLSFLADFFGCEWTPDQILTGVEQCIPNEDVVPLESRSFAEFAEARRSRNNTEIKESSARLAMLLNPHVVGSDPEARLCDAIESRQNSIGAQMLGACFEEMRTRAVSLSDFATRVFVDSSEIRVARKAVKGLLIARGLCAARGVAKLLPSFRLHWFFRNVEGLWACVLPDCQCDGTHLDGRRPVGRLFPQNRIRCGNHDQQHRVLELLYCEQCGTIFFGGSRLRTTVGGAVEILSTDPDIEGLPDRQIARFVDKRTYRDFAVYWPQGASTLNHEAKTWRQPRASGSDWERGRWARKYLSAISGRVTDVSDGVLVPRGNSIPGYLYMIPGVDSTDDEPEFSALPACCPNCAADYSHRIFRKSPIRSFRTGFSRVSQLLSKELFYNLPQGDTKKLVVFSDSREDAASISNGIERTHYLDLIREAMYDELHQVAVGEGMLLADLELHGEPRSTEAIACARDNPETENRFSQALTIANTPIPDGLAKVLRETLWQQKREAETTLQGVNQRSVTRMVPVAPSLRVQSPWRTGHAATTLDQKT